VARIEPHTATTPEPHTQTGFPLGNRSLPNKRRKPLHIRSTEVKRHPAVDNPAQQDDSQRGDPLTAGSSPTTVDPGSMTRAQLTALPLSTDVALTIAEQHGVCVRPIAMRRINTTTGRIDIIAVPCGTTREDYCRPCADKARRLRMAQCREGWHLEIEPAIERAKPSETQQELMATRADLFAAYAECHANGDEVTCEQIADSVAELDAELRATGVRVG
jgi:Replication initiator protein, pSAM2